MDLFETKRVTVRAFRFDIHQRPWPTSVETVVGDIGVPHPVIIGVTGNINLSHGDWVVYTPIGIVTMNDTLFRVLFRPLTSMAEVAGAPLDLHLDETQLLPAVH